MRRCLLLLLTTLLVTVAATAQTVQQWRDSLSVLSRQISARPQSTDLRLRKAAVNIELGQWDYAIDEYGRVLEIDDKNLSALYFRAYAYNHLRRYDMARADYERFLNIMPRHFEARLGLAMTKRNQGKQMEALDELNRLVEMYPDSALSYAVRAGFEMEREQYELALYDWDEAISRDATNLEYKVSKYSALWALKRYDEARRLGDALVKQGVEQSVLEPLQTPRRKRRR